MEQNDFTQKEVLPSMEELLNRAYQQGRNDAIEEMKKFVVDHGCYTSIKTSEWIAQIEGKNESEM